MIVRDGAPPVYTLTVDVWQIGAPHPLIRHVFFGRTPARARALFKAHVRVDEFLRGAWERGALRMLVKRLGADRPTARRIAA